ncbi:baseplate J/gp47 family protein [Erwinia psidii]|uniref:baseplate J/gp47 family protein n=1 Tax=Erwinia psidii TaxID=69224 RepID=UPI00226B4273|nr:baseplate J/gp47 family protein [Erwinia psidii]MCX8962128.1 baseplate J/gp47 family protein [Erwinia psidii]
MPYTTPVLTAIRTDLLRDIKNLLPDADTGTDSDFYVRASSVASAVEGLYHHQSWIVRQIFADTADTEYLEQHCRLRQIFRKAATAATGTATFSGSAGATADSGLIIKRDGISRTTTEAVTIDASGTGAATVQASDVGTAGNTSATSGMLTSVPDGFESTVLISDMVGGTDQETDAALLARLLEAIRRPAAGGNKYDYRNWALAVDGVTGAYVWPLRRGLGTVDVIIVSGDGLPSDETLAAVQAYIDDQRPVTAKNCLVLKPVEMFIDFEIKVWLEGVTLDSVTLQIEETIKTWFSYLAPGETAVLTTLGGQISGLTGVWDYRFVTPTANVIAVDSVSIGWLRPGNISVTDGSA